MRIRIKRIEDHRGDDNGLQVLVNRQWPRDLKKADARIDLWANDQAPDGVIVGPDGPPWITDGGLNEIVRDDPDTGSKYIPDPTAEVGHCVHRIAMHPSRPQVLFMQKHWNGMRSDDAGDSWREMSGNLPSDFGFVIEVQAHEPDTLYVVPIKSVSEHYPPDGRLRVYRSHTGWRRMGAAHQWSALPEAIASGTGPRVVVAAISGG